MMKKEILIFQNGAHFLSVFLKMSLVTVGKLTTQRGNEGEMAGRASTASQSVDLHATRAEQQQRKQECWPFPVMIV